MLGHLKMQFLKDQTGGLVSKDHWCSVMIFVTRITNSKFPISQSPVDISGHEPIFGPPASNWLWLIWCNADSAQQQPNKGGFFVLAFFLIEIPTCIYCPFTLRLIREGWRYHQFQIFGLGITNDVRCYNLYIHKAPGIIEHRTDNLLG